MAQRPWPQVIKQSVVELRLQAEDSFVLKVVQLEELLQVRHSVFIIGNAGSGKSQVSARLALGTQGLLAAVPRFSAGQQDWGPQGSVPEDGLSCTLSGLQRHCCF